ncbi:MAG: DUF1217 domain-containing protein [Parvularculaceae bacterium]
MYQPAIFASGYAGFKLFERTTPRQMEAFSRSAEVKRDIAYFMEKIGEAATPADLVADRRLLKVALGAFGLGEEIDKRAFIRKALEGGTEARDAFANRMSDARWRAFASAFGYGDSAGAQTGKPGFAAGIADRYRERAFEAAVGATDENFRLAMNFRREAAAIASAAETDRAGWLKMLAQKPLRAVLEGALRLPKAMAHLDIDRQVAIVEDKARETFGSSSPAALASPEIMDKALRRFFVRADLATASANAPGSTALTLLSNASAASLLLSNAIR